MSCSAARTECRSTQLSCGADPAHCWTDPVICRTARTICSAAQVICSAARTVCRAAQVICSADRCECGVPPRIGWADFLPARTISLKSPRNHPILHGVRENLRPFRREAAVQSHCLLPASLVSHSIPHYGGVTTNFAVTGRDQGVDDGGPSVWCRLGSRARATMRALPGS